MFIIQRDDKHRDKFINWHKWLINYGEIVWYSLYDITHRCP